MKKFIAFIFLYYFAFLSVFSINTKGNEYVNTSIVNGEIEIPRPPSTLNTTHEKAEFMIINFWNPLNFNDTTFTRDENFIEQNFVNFISIFPYAEPQSRKEAVFNLLNKSKIDPKTYASFMDVANKYLYDTDSPMINEDYYLPFMEFVAQDEDSSKAYKEMALYTIESINKNRPGTPAADFEFYDKEGITRSLHSLFPDRETMLIFFDPECENCKNVITEICQNPQIAQRVDEGNLGIVAVYSGINLTMWLRELPLFPDNWIVGHEPEIIDYKELYDIRSLPTILLLGPDKTVIEKNFNINSFSK